MPTITEGRPVNDRLQNALKSANSASHAVRRKLLDINIVEPFSFHGLVEPAAASFGAKSLLSRSDELMLHHSGTIDAMRR